jgi:hypothetical protein
VLREEGLALFAGLNTIPKRSYLAAYSSRMGRKRNLRCMETWFDHLQKAGLARSGSLDLDYHTVPANAEREPLEKDYVSRRSRREKGVLVFDPQLTTYANLRRLDEQGIAFLTLRRRSRKMLAEIFSDLLDVGGTVAIEPRQVALRRATHRDVASDHPLSRGAPLGSG